MTAKFRMKYDYYTFIHCLKHYYGIIRIKSKGLTSLYQLRCAKIVPHKEFICEKQ
jgi:hypothetical protein